MWVTDAEADITEGDCLWPIVACGTVPADMDEEVYALVLQAAAGIMHAASGRQFGECVSTVRPCSPRCEGFAQLNMWDVIDRRSPYTTVSFHDSLVEWRAMHCGRCRGDACSCTNVERIRLWHRNPTGIVSVQIDGEPLDSSAYRLDNGHLYRVDGERWPPCQDMNVDNGEPGSWSVTYRHGRPVPAAGQLATGQLAVEMAKACVDDEDCELPRRVQTVTREGVSVAFVDPMTFLEQGRTGLYLADLWLNTVNPSRLRRRSRVFRADAPRTGRRARGGTGS